MTDPDPDLDVVKSFKPVGRFVISSDYVMFIRATMRILTALEKDPVNLEACMAELRVLESKYGSK